MITTSGTFTVMYFVPDKVTSSVFFQPSLKKTNTEDLQTGS